MRDSLYLAVLSQLLQQAGIAELRRKFGVCAGALEIAFRNIDFAQSDVGRGERRFLFERDQQVALGVVAAVLDAQQFRHVIVTFRPLGILFERTLLLGDLLRCLAIEHLVGYPAQELFRHLDNVPQGEETRHGTRRGMYAPQ